MADRRRVRAIPTDFRTREEGGEMFLEGYFAVYNSNYVIEKSMTESIAPGAFSRSIRDGDIRALINHDSTLVLGRTKANTLELREDERGLWGRVAVNPNDGDAVNCYQRVSRGDVDGCSFGFEIREEETDFLDDGSVHFTIKDVDLYEVSVCTFPAYEATNISAREKDAARIRAKGLEAWKKQMRERAEKWH